MSIFRTVHVACPACNTPVAYELVHSVNAGRRPDLRESILDGSFQLQRCPSCGQGFRIEPEFIYIDLPRRQYIGVWPVSRRGQWRECATQTREVFESAMGSRAPPEARGLAEGLVVRVVFGWHALVEKILAQQAGIDDRTLEVAKLAVMRSQDELPMPGRSELRLVGDQEGDPLLAWVGAAQSIDDDEASPVLRVPRQLISDIESDPATWAAARDSAGEGDVVDFQREVLAAA